MTHDPASKTSIVSESTSLAHSDVAAASASAPSAKRNWQISALPKAAAIYMSVSQCSTGLGPNQKRGIIYERAAVYNPGV